ncbi:hypothetical protein [Nocardia wallacei]|uniref:hypothetical protein n=1 Tax=Nocardia wallacei TaxID=480035 RepID=UPI002455FD6D|nr:hypothetical protein [Nocardia wallacei]
MTPHDPDGAGTGDDTATGGAAPEAPQAPGAGLFSRTVPAARTHFLRPRRSTTPPAPRADRDDAEALVAEVTELRDTIAAAAAEADPGGTLPPVPKLNKRRDEKRLRQLAEAATAARAEWDIPDYDAVAAAASDDPDDDDQAAAKAAEDDDARPRSVVLLRRRGLRAGGAVRGVVAVVGVAAVIAAGVGGIAYVTWHTDDADRMPGSRPAAVEPAAETGGGQDANGPPAWATADCTSRRDADTTIGADPGSTTSLTVVPVARRTACTPAPRPAPTATQRAPPRGTKNNESGRRAARELFLNRKGAKSGPENAVEPMGEAEPLAG